jgi:hypothetical protein
VRRSPPTPLLRDADIRAVIAALFVLDGLVLAGAVWLSLVWLAHTWTLWLVPAAVVSGSVTAWAVARGRVTGRMAGVGVLVTVGLHLALASLAVVEAADAWRARPAFATDPDDTAWWLAVAVAALLVLAALLACLGLPVRRAAIATAIALLGAAGVAGVAGAVVSASADDCGGFRFSPERWRQAIDRGGGREEDEAVALADALVRCRTLDGRTRADVRRLLGRPHRSSPSTWTWSIGWVNDFLGPGDAEALSVRFGGRGRARVTAVSRLYGNPD